MMRKFAIVTDSASDIPRDTAVRLGICVVPMRISAGGEELRDGTGITTSQHLDLLRGSETVPRTSMPSPIDFIETYRLLAIQGYTDVLSIHISRALSATIEMPRYLSRSVFNNLNIKVIDSRAATAAEGAMVLEAAAVADAGGTIGEAVAKVLAMRDLIRIQFAPNSLSNLVKGGRATALQAVTASVLRVKPVIDFDGSGGLHVARKVQGFHKAAKFMAEELVAHAREQGELVYFTLHTSAEKALGKLETAIRKHGVPGTFGGHGTIGACIAAHVGEGAIGTMSYPRSLHNPELPLEDMLLKG